MTTMPNFVVDRRVATTSFPATTQLLLDGGDGRIAQSSDGSGNRYGCGALPDASLLAFGSSTASTISAEGFAAAETLRNRISKAIETAPTSKVYAREIESLRTEFKDLSGVASSEVIFAASGTDLHLICGQLCGGHGKVLPTRIVIMDPAETGRGVPTALAGLHFSGHSALGQTVAEGMPLADGSILELISVPIRTRSGEARSIDAINEDVERLVCESGALGQPVLLVVVDVSKTGLLAPSPSCAMSLHKRFPGLVEVLIDACQFRLSQTTLAGYLEHDFMVAVTGSKFLTGPTFSGALFIPHGASQRLRLDPVPSGLSAYSAKSDWPSDWHSAAALDDSVNFGMLARWHAAIFELRAFRSVSDAMIANVLTQFKASVLARLNNDPLFEVIDVPTLYRGIGDPAGWDTIQTIFPFVLYHPQSSATEPRRPLTSDETLRVYSLLPKDLSEVWDDEGADVRCQLGQPVNCGSRNGMVLSALRICASARLVVAASQGSGIDRVLADAHAALDKVALIVRHVDLARR